MITALSPKCIHAAIIGQTEFVRGGLAALIGDSHYRVSDMASTVNELKGIVGAAARPLILKGSLDFEASMAAVGDIRQFWPESRCVLMIDNVSLHERQALIEAGAHGCMPLFSSRARLLSILDLVVYQGMRVIVVAAESGQAEIEACVPVAQLECLGQNANGFIAPAECPPLGVIDLSLVEGISPQGPITLRCKRSDELAPLQSARREPKLSARERQVLIGLMKGDANKVIARACGVAEGTVKVHIKSLFRKIHVDNRTQAALWAISNDSFALPLSGGDITIE